MNTIKSKLRTVLTAFFASLSLLFAALGFVACGANNLKIDVPERIEEDMGTGTYVVPRYDVVNDIGVIMAGYTVRLKSVTDPNGEAAEISREASTIVTLSGAGEYTFVYTADSKRVKDATVIMDFADRKAPTIKLSSSQFPAFFIQGVTYAVPEYTLSGDFVASKCYTKVFYNDGQSEEETEVTMDDGSFTVTNAAGKYTVLIHVEDAAGNFNEYRYTRSVHSPEHYDEHTVVYFNEAFGERQVTPDGNYAGHYVSVADGGKGHDGEAGSYKVVFNGKETTNNEAYFSIDVPAIANIMAYKELEMYVYIEDDECAGGASEWVVGSKWWNDQRAKVGDWTRITWSVANWGNGTGANCGSTTANVISTDNISGTRIRLIPDCDYEGKTAPHGTVYFSSMRVVPHKPSVVTAGENVTLDKRDGNYHIGDTVTLTAAEIEGKTLDCFLLDGKPIGGNTFVASNATHAVTAKYVDGALTADNMTWGSISNYATEGTDAKKQTLGTGTHWVLTYQPEFAETGWVYTAAYVGGANQLFGIEMHSDNDSRKLSGYGGAWKGDVALPVSEEVRDALRASKTTPVTMIYVRDGDYIGVYLQKDSDITFLGSVAFSKFEVSGDDFGIGERAGNIQNAALKNIKWIVGETKTNLYLGTLAVTLTKDANVTTDQENYYLGETVTLTAAEAPAGKAFAYFTVDGTPITGNTFVLEKFSYKIAAVYTEISKLTLDKGIATSDGKTTVGKGATVTLTFTGKSPAGKYFVGFKVDDASIEGNTFVTSQSAHSITAEFADRVQNDNEMLNDASKVQGASDWKSKGNYFPASVEYVTDFCYDGIDASVPEGGVLKVTVSGADNGFSLTQTCGKFMSDYESLYFYAYTEASGVKVGSWWCGDTALTPGKWCKVTITRTMNLVDFDNQKIFETTIDNFVYRFMSGKSGDVIYVTEVFGVPYADVTVTVNNEVKDYVSVSAPANGTTYKANETITLSHSGAPANKEFAYFTIDGARYDGTTYTLGTDNVTVGAVFGDISTLKLGSGITTSDGKTQYACGVKVTLVLGNDATPAGKIFNYFTVDGTRIAGNTFETVNLTHTVAAVFVDGAEELTWVTSEEAAGSVHSYSWSDSAYNFSGKAVGESEHWVIEAKAYGFDGLGSKWFSLDFLVGGNASLQIRLHSAGHALIQAMGANHKDGKELIALDASVITRCQAATQESPVTFTAIRNGNIYYVLFEGELVLKTEFAFNVDSNAFGIGGTDCSTWLTSHPATVYKYRAGEAIAQYSAKVTVTGTKVMCDHTDYTLGDTVTLTHDAAETGYAFSHYTVDGKRIDGDSFVANKNSYTVAAVYAEVSQLTLGEGVLTADENTEYARGVRVRLSFDPAKLNGKVVDYYLIDKDTDNELRVYNGEFTTTAATHTVDAVLVEPSAMTWANGGTGYNYETVMGSDSAEWKARALDGEVYGAAEYWAVSVDVKHTTEWNSFEFIQGSKQSIRVRFHQGSFCGVVLMTSKDKEEIPTSEFTVAHPTQNPQVVAKLLAGATVTCVRNGGTISMYVDGYQFFKTDYAVDHAGNWFGVGHVDSQNATKPEMSNTKFITGKDKVEAYLAAYAASDKAPKSETQINGISGATVFAGTANLEYVEAPAGLTDTNVSETKALKVDVTSSDGEVTLNVDYSFIPDLTAFEEVYFWIYTEAEGVQGGTRWCANANATAGQWTKITVTRNTNWTYAGGVKYDGVPTGTHGNPYDQNNSRSFTFRIMGAENKTVYVTSLYGVPKTAE